MLNKNDPLVGAIQDIMIKNQAERDAVKAVNEKFGVQDRRVLPREKQSEWDAAYQTVLTEGVEALDEKVQMSKKQFANLDGDPKFTSNDLDHARAGTHKKKVAAGNLEEDDTTSPSSMGIKKPDYAPAGTTPDYAKPKEQTVNRAAKTSLPPGTMKEENLEEKAPPGREDQVKALKKKFPKGSGSPFAIAWSSYKKKKKLDEGFNGRHDSSVTASVEGQVVADQLNEAGGPAPSVVKASQQAAKNAPKQQSTATGAFTRAAADSATDLGQSLLGYRSGYDYAKAGVDYLAKNAAWAVGSGKGTTYSKELDQEKEKDDIAAKEHPIATTAGNVAGTAATLAVPGAGAAKVASTTAKVVKGTETAIKAAKGTETAAKIASGTEKAASSASDVSKFISKAKSTPVSAAAKEGGAATSAVAKPVSAAARETGNAGSTAAANAAKYSKPGTTGGRFSDNLAKARKGSENYGPSKGGVAVRKTTEPATVTRPGVPAVAKKPGVPAVANRPGLPAVANRPGLPAVAGSAASTAAKTSRFGGLGKALKYGAVAAAVGGAGYGLMNKSQPDSTQAATPPSTGAKQGGGSTSAKTQSTAKPGTQQAVKDRVVQKVAARSKLQSRNQRDDTIGASGRPTQGPGGVTSGTKTGKIITNRPAVVKKNPIGMGRVK